MWYHGECVNLSIGDAQSLQRYHCPKCSEKKGVPYPFGTIVFRHARPTVAECHALLAWVDEQLQAKQAAQLLQCDNARPLRRVLARIDEFKARVSHWLVGRHDGDTTPAAASSAVSPPGEHAKSEATSESPSAGVSAASSVAARLAAVATSPPLSLDASELSLIKGFIRQGKKLGINFSELSQSAQAKAPPAATDLSQSAARHMDVAERTLPSRCLTVFSFSARLCSPLPSLSDSNDCMTRCVALTPLASPQLQPSPPQTITPTNRRSALKREIERHIQKANIGATSTFLKTLVALNVHPFVH